MVASPSQFGPLRGLLYAEAQALLVTLWDANGESTAMFMKCFYEGLASTASKAVALQHAMRSLWATYPHPHHGHLSC